MSRPCPAWPRLAAPRAAPSHAANVRWFLPGAVPLETHAGTAAVLGTVCFVCPNPERENHASYRQPVTRFPPAAGAGPTSQFLSLRRLVFRRRRTRRRMQRRADRHPLRRSQGTARTDRDRRARRGFVFLGSSATVCLRRAYVDQCLKCLSRFGISEGRHRHVVDLETDVEGRQFLFGEPDFRALDHVVH